MADEIIEQREQVLSVEVTQNDGFNPFIEDTWNESPINENPKKENSDTSSEQKQTNAPLEEEDVFDADEYLKKNLGFDNWNTAKEELEKLRNKREEIKFANEQSEKLFSALKEGKEDEVYNFLNEKKKFERIDSLDLSKKENAAELIKLSLQHKKTKRVNV